MAALTLSEKLDQLDAATRNDQELSTPRSSLIPRVSRNSPSSTPISKRSSTSTRVQANRKRLAATHQMVVESDDAEMRHMAQKKKSSLPSARTTERELKLLLLPTIPSTTKTLS